jgi:hypothetical protein
VNFAKLLIGFLLLLIVLSPTATAQTTPAPTTPPVTLQDGSTSDYLPDALRLLFPAAPASLTITDVQSPLFPSDAPGFDIVPMGVLTDVNQTLTRTLSLELAGGIRGRIFARPAWLAPVPNRFINPAGVGKLDVTVRVRQDAGQGAGILPGQTNWGRLLLSLNGVLFDYGVPVIVPPPARIGRDDAERVFGLHREIATQLDAQGDLEAFIGSPDFPNGGQFALGLVVDYLGENEYNGRLSRADFVNRVTETLSRKDYNGDGWLGFKTEDIVLGAPGWLLGKAAR